MSTELAWAAGFFDGEGCVSISRTKHKNGRDYHQLQVSVSQRDPRPIERLYVLFGGWQRTNAAGVIQWGIKAGDAATMLRALLPHLVNKRDQAAIAIRFQARRNTGRGRLAVQDREQDVADYEAVKSLKRAY